MKLRPSLRAAGFSDADGHAAESFLYVALRRLSPLQTWQAIDWYRTRFRRGMTPTEVVTDFKEFAELRGWDAGDINTVHDWFYRASTQGVDALPVDAPPPQAFIEKTLSEIRDRRRAGEDIGPADEVYEADMLALRDGNVGAMLEDKPGAPAAGSKRLAEIREQRRTDPDLYDRSPDLQREELALIETSLPAPGEFNG